MKIAYITYSGAVKYAAANGFNENTDLLPFLKNKGLDIESIIWDDPNVDWQQFDITLLKTPWDYHQKFEAFSAWLGKLESLNIRLLNDYATVRWNMDKHYLKEIAAAGFDMIPSIFIKKGWNGELNALFEGLGAKEIIIKPCISGGSNNTISINITNAEQTRPEIIDLLAKGDYIAQPLMPEVQQGEWSHIFFDGKHSHSIIKKPKQGDFRVQQIYGGTIEPLQPTNAQIAHARSYLEKFAPDTLYARVDGLMVNDRFMLMELELIEPFLYLSYDENAVENYYQALTKHI